MVIVKEMSKPSVKVSVSNSESSSEEGDESEYESEVSDKGYHKTKPESEMSDNGDESGSNKESDDDVIIKNEGWADSVAKILSSKKPKNKKTLVLSRAKKLADTVKKEKEEKPSFEIVGDAAKEVKIEVKKETLTVSEPPVKKKKVERLSIRIKPNILEKDREKLLTKIATKGVVQLFNAVRNQQKTIEKEIKDIPEGKKEKVLKKFDKRTFLDTLMGQSKSVNVEEQTKPLKDEVKTESEKPRWNALRDDFMMGAKMKDWDKESAEESD
ncbi:RRP15-like protein isoform X2 [Maniola hyperantus]|uniref:RRP15-like protein isoform X2 n=1 Tax=Aphantopus hyperantus TaxID=2795564 RepID=UPI0015698AAF|nr:RRP15-like protein [Maniola hyperantus]